MTNTTKLTKVSKSNMKPIKRLFKTYAEYFLKNIFLSRNPLISIWWS